MKGKGPFPFPQPFPCELPCSPAEHCGAFFFVFFPVLAGSKGICRSGQNELPSWTVSCVNFGFLDGGPSFFVSFLLCACRQSVCVDLVDVSNSVWTETDASDADCVRGAWGPWARVERGGVCVCVSSVVGRPLRCGTTIIWLMRTQRSEVLAVCPVFRLGDCDCWSRAEV